MIKPQTIPKHGQNQASVLKPCCPEYLHYYSTMKGSEVYNNTVCQLTQNITSQTLCADKAHSLISIQAHASI